MNLETTTNAGLQEFVLGTVLKRYPKSGERAIDLGAGTGRFALLLHRMGWDVIGADKDSEAFRAPIPFVKVDLDAPCFDRELGQSGFSLVTAIEVIEHMESPIGFLRNSCRLLKPGGVMVFTTPNVDSVPARIKFLLTDKIRMMDDMSEPTHISPVFWDLLVRQLLPRSGLELVQHRLFPERGFQLTRRRFSVPVRMLAGFFGGECVHGDNHVIVVRPRCDRSTTLDDCTVQASTHG
ncbi:MAG: class I SAM-dependent methyltransferase [Candidatus Acidiferrales bacterium]